MWLVAESWMSEWASVHAFCGHICDVEQGEILVITHLVVCWSIQAITG